MLRLRKLFFVGLSVCLAAFPRARSQTLQGGQPAAQTGSHKAAKRGDVRGALATGAISKDSVLSFEPGIGWHLVPMGKLSVSETPSDSIPGRVEPSAESRLNTDYTKSSGVSSQLMRQPIPIRPRGTHLSSGARADVSSGRIADLESHAYISPIKLRIMIRNAPDLETRIKLQELQEKLVNKSHIFMGSSKGSPGSKGQPKGPNGDRAHSSSLSGDHDRTTDGLRILSSRTYP